MKINFWSMTVALGIVSSAWLPVVWGQAADREDPAEVTPALAMMYDGMINAQDGQYDQAIPKLEWAIAEDPTLIGAWETLGWSYWHVGRAADAKVLWENLRALIPDEPQVYRWLASLATERRAFDEAVALLQKSLDLDPDQFEARLDLARVFLWRGRLGDAIRMARALLDEDPDRLDVALELARALQYAWRYAETLPLWNRLLEVAPDVTEYRLGAARALLHAGERKQAVEIASTVLEVEPDNVQALTIMADDAEYGARPQNARPYLYRAIASTNDAEERDLLRRRLVALLLRLRHGQPLLYPLEEPIRLSRDRVRDEAMNSDAQLVLGELLLMNRHYEDSEAVFYRVLRELNVNNLRALRGLFEIAMARFRFDEARGFLERIRAFNPDDPYLLSDEAMLYARHGDFARAHQAVDKLEQIGGQGAAAVLSYRMLSPSEIGPAMPVARFHEHLKALRAAGYQFITTDELPGYLERVSGFPDRVAGIAPTRAVVVTFDDALDYAMQLATPIARQMGLVFTQFIPVGAVDDADPLVASWEALRQWQRGGQWHYGSLLMRAQDVARVFRSGAPLPPLANRIWREDLSRLENVEEFDLRLEGEYAQSREIIERKIGRPLDAVAYPFGDIGQESVANEPSAIAANLAKSQRHYATGFIVRNQGHAVRGDNPSLYGRYEPAPWMSGEAVVRHLIGQHPVFLAQRLRLEFATFEGRRGLARQTLENMERSGYPPEEIDRLKAFVKARLARKFDMPHVVDDVRKGPWSLQIENPYVGVAGLYFADSLDGESRHFEGLGGLHLTPNMTLRARAGIGWHTQPAVVTNLAVPLGPDIEIRETYAALAASAVLPYRSVLSWELGRRDFFDDADWTLWRYALALNLRPVDAIDMKLEYDHDAGPGARALRRELTYDRIAAHGVWSPSDRWDVWGSGQQFEFSDGNRRTHWHVLPMVLLWRPPGLRVGLRYAESTSSKEDIDYWTPYKQQSVHLEAGFRGTWRRQYYNLIGRVGQAREGIRPRAQQEHADLLATYEDLLQRAQRGRWGRRAQDDIQREVDNLRANPPESEWETVYGVDASWGLRWSAHWELTGQFSYDKSPRYNETRAGAGLTYRW